MSEQTSVPTPKIRLDPNRPWSTNSGEMVPEDPHYTVASFQGQKIKVKDARTGRMVEKMVVLPFDAHGDLVRDDGKKEPWQGMNAEQKPCTYRPLWNDDMRQLHALLVEKAKNEGIEPEEPELIEPSADETPALDFKAFLTGQARYAWPLLQKAAREQLHRVYTSKEQLVRELVLEENLVAPEAVCAELAPFLRDAA